MKNFEKLSKEELRYWLKKCTDALQNEKGGRHMLAIREDRDDILYELCRRNS